jgi:hypothetical protein
MAGEKGFALLFIVLMAPAAVPLPTGGVTHVLEIVAMLVALQLVAGRQTFWIPQRWRQLDLVGTRGERFAATLVHWTRWLEGHSRPRLRSLLRHGLSRVIFGVLVLALSATAFLAPPFSGLDTLPAMGVVVLSLGVLLEDFVVAIAGVLIGAVGVALVIALGSLAVRGIAGLF